MGSPPPVGLKKLVPTSRSKARRINAPANTGVEMTAKQEVANIDQQNKGIWFHPIPGVRIFQMVTIKLIPAKMEEVPSNRTLIIQIASPALPLTMLKGGYEVQPAPGAPTKKLLISSMPAGGIIQKAIAFSLGNAISLAPISKGTR